MKKKYIFAAVKTDEDLDLALNSKVKVIFLMLPNIITLEEEVKKIHSKNKKVFIHIDLAEGIGKDKYGLLYVKSTGVDGIISTRQNLIKTAKDIGLKGIQRIFLVDSHSVDTAIESLKFSKPFMVEIMPGIMPKIIKKLCENSSLSIIAGGLIDKEEEVSDAFLAGASAISTGNKNLWNYNTKEDK